MTPQKIDLSNLHNLSEKEILVAVAVTLNSVCDKVTQQNGRVARLEAWRSYIMGGLAVIGITVGILGGYLVSQLP